MRPFHIQRRLNCPVSWRPMWIVGEARGLHDLQINRGQVVDLRKDGGILGDGCRAIGVDNHYRFASSIKACRVQRFELIGSLHLIRRISLRRKVAQRGIGDVRSVTISSISGRVGRISKSVSLGRAKCVTLEK